MESLPESTLATKLYVRASKSAPWPSERKSAHEQLYQRAPLASPGGCGVLHMVAARISQKMHEPGSSVQRMTRRSSLVLSLIAPGKHVRSVLKGKCDLFLIPWCGLLGTTTPLWWAPFLSHKRSCRLLLPSSVDQRQAVGMVRESVVACH